MPVPRSNDDADVHRADAMTRGERAEVGNDAPKIVQAATRIVRSAKRRSSLAKAVAKIMDAIKESNVRSPFGQPLLIDPERIRAMSALPEDGVTSSPSHVSRLAGRTPAGQRSSDGKPAEHIKATRAEPRAEHAQQVDDAHIIRFKDPAGYPYVRDVEVEVRSVDSGVVSLRFTWYATEEDPDDECEIVLPADVVKRIAAMLEVNP